MNPHFHTYKMFNPENYRDRIKEILTESDLASISSKQVRRILLQQQNEQETGCLQLDKEQKRALDQLILQLYDEVVAEAGHETAADADEDTTTTSSIPNSNTNVKKEKETAVHSVRSSSKKIKSEALVFDEEDVDDEYDLQVAADPTSRDESIARALQSELNSRPGRLRTASAQAKKRPRTNRQTDTNADNTLAKKRKRGTSTFSKPYKLSEALSRVVGDTQIARHEVVKRLWVYIKERELQDPKDKRNIICDDALKAVFKSDKINCFKMNKVLSLHMVRADEAGGDVVVSSDEEEDQEEGLDSSSDEQDKKKPFKRKSTSLATARGEKISGFSMFVPSFSHLSLIFPLSPLVTLNQFSK